MYHFMIHYSDLVLHYFRQPDHVVKRDRVYQYQVEKELIEPKLCVRFYADFADGVLKCLQFSCEGDVASIALAAYCCEQLQGQTVDALWQLRADGLMQALDLPSMKQHCAIVIAEALHALSHRICAEV